MAEGTNSERSVTPSHYIKKQWEGVTQEGGTKVQCKHPLIRVEMQTVYTKCKDGHLTKKAKIMSTTEYEQWAKVHNELIKVQEIPCGKCIGCRLDYSKNWATRAMLEAAQYKESYFVTLTYNETNKPYEFKWPNQETGEIYTDDGSWNGYLIPEEASSFIKRVREYYRSHYNHTGIRFMMAGEYGEKTARPHYHLIMFNMPIPAEELKVYKQTYNHDYLYTWDTLTEKWGKGNVIIGECNWNTCAYVARYMCKKQKGPDAKEYYARKGQTKEFMRMSNRPGIARAYYDTHARQIYDKDELIMKGRNGKAVSIKPPKYFDNLFKINHEEELEIIKEKREKACQNMERSNASQTTLNKAQRLEQEERSIKQRTASLKRQFEEK